jgi:hypothetical protein
MARSWANAGGSVAAPSLSDIVRLLTGVTFPIRTMSIQPKTLSRPIVKNAERQGRSLRFSRSAFPNLFAICYLLLPRSGAGSSAFWGLQLVLGSAVFRKSPFLRSST